jgi:hypothetical protein
MRPRKADCRIASLNDKLLFRAAWWDVGPFVCDVSWTPSNGYRARVSLYFGERHSVHLQSERPHLIHR